MSKTRADTACDRCHNIRAKCTPSNFSTSCCRCYRLNHQCSYTRIRGFPGRKRKSAISDPPGLPPDQSDQHHAIPIVENGIGSPCTHPHGWHFDSLRVGLEEDRQLELYFTVVPGMAPSLARHWWACLTGGPPILLETYLALRHTFYFVHRGQQNLSDASLSTNTDALRSLRNACLQSSKDIVQFLWLTAIVQSFDRLARGNLSTNSILEWSLARLQPVQAQLTDNPRDTSPTLTCFIFIDTASSMFKSCLPIMKMPSAFEDLIDRFAGLCGSLLPLLYDVCGLLAATKNSASHCRETDEIVQQWSDTYTAIIAWEPSFSSVSFLQFSSVDQTVLLYAYRAAALLLLGQIRPSAVEHLQYHRQTPNENHLEMSLVDTILFQTRLCLQMINEPPPFTNLPLVVAALGTTDESIHDELISILERSRGLEQHGCVAQLKSTLTKFLSKNDQGLGKNWLWCLEELAVSNILL